MTAKARSILRSSVAAKNLLKCLKPNSLRCSEGSSHELSGSPSAASSGRSEPEDDVLLSTTGIESIANPKSPKRAKPTGNLLLSRMSPSDRELIEPHLQEIELPLRMRLEQRKKRVEYVYFVDTGMASVVANGDGEVEVGIIGRDGATGLSVVLANDRASHDAYIQVAGTGRRLPTDVLRQAMSSSPSLTTIMLRHVNSFLVQVSETASANARGTIEQRLARWLLMVDDRMEEQALPLTHEFLAIMLSVNRPGVTVALKSLEYRGTISQRRGHVKIVDRTALQKIAGFLYAKATF